MDLGDGSNGRLPGIQEDKAWVRKSLEYVNFTSEGVQQELINTSEGDILPLAENTESPDLGPPPVAHFEDEDPIKFDAQPTTTTPEPELKSQAEELPPALSMNLETRRKRRDSQGKLNIRRMSVFHSPPERIEDQSSTEARAISGTLPIRAGAKRKMSVREDEGRTENKASNDFTFSRKSSVAFEDPVKTDKEMFAENDVKPRAKRESITIQPPERRALSSKPVNTDPVVSPKKPTLRGKTSDGKPHQKKTSEHTSKEAPRPRSRQSIKPLAEEPLVISIPLTQESAPRVAEVQPMTQPHTLPPKTPAAPPDLFSPVTTEPSTSRPQAGRDTPPPGDIGAASDANAGRAGRRARTSVNYAEPSLNSKMRRPSAQLVDAVDSRGRSVPGIMVPSSAAQERILTASMIKTARDDEAWRSLPATGEAASPLSKKSTGIAPLTQITGNGVEVREDIPVQSAAAAAISTLIQSNKERRKSQGLVLSTEKDGRKERDSLRVFDFVSSSPPRDDVSAKMAERARTASRRHSAIPGSVTVGKKERFGDVEGRTESRTGHKSQNSANVVGLKEVSPPIAMSSVDEGTGMARSQRANRRSSMLG